MILQRYRRAGLDSWSWHAMLVAEPKITQEEYSRTLEFAARWLGLPRPKRAA